MPTLIYLPGWWELLGKTFLSCLTCCDRVLMVVIGLSLVYDLHMHWIFCVFLETSGHTPMELFWYILNSLFHKSICFKLGFKFYIRSCSALPYYLGPSWFWNVKTELLLPWFSILFSLLFSDSGLLCFHFQVSNSDPVLTGQDVTLVCSSPYKSYSPFKCSLLADI